MDLTLTDEEASVLRQVLEGRLSELNVEVRHSVVPAYRGELKARRSLLHYTGSGSDCRLLRPLSRLAPARAKARRSNRAVFVKPLGGVPDWARGLVRRAPGSVAVGRLGGSLPDTGRCGPSTPRPPRGCSWKPEALRTERARAQTTFDRATRVLAKIDALDFSGVRKGRRLLPGHPHPGVAHDRGQGRTDPALRRTPTTGSPRRRRPRPGWRSTPGTGTTR